MKRLVPVFIVLLLGFFVTCALSQDEGKKAEDGKKIKVKKVQVDSNFDGTIDRTESYNANGDVEKVEIDGNEDGKIDEWITYQNGKPLKSERDTNGDGKADVWIDY